MSNQRVGYRGRRPKGDPPDGGYRNQPMDRTEAVDVAIEVGLTLGEVRVEIVPRGDGYDLRVPAEMLAGLILLLRRQAAAIVPLEAIVGHPLF